MAAHLAVRENDLAELRKLYNGGSAHLFSEKDHEGLTPTDRAAMQCTTPHQRDALKMLLLLVNGGGAVTLSSDDPRLLYGNVVLKMLQTPHYPTTITDADGEKGMSTPQFVKDLQKKGVDFKSPRIVQAFVAARSLMEFHREAPLDITKAMEVGAFDDEFARGPARKFLIMFAQMEVTRLTKGLEGDAAPAEVAFKRLMLQQHNRFLRAPLLPGMGNVPVYNLSTALQKAINTVLRISNRLATRGEQAMVKDGLPIMPPELWYLMIEHLLHCVKPYEYSNAPTDHTRSNFGGKHPLLSRLLQRC